MHICTTSNHKKIKIKLKTRGGKVAYQVRVLTTTKPGNLSLLPEAHMTEGENQLQQAVLCSMGLRSPTNKCVPGDLGAKEWASDPLEQELQISGNDLISPGN